MLKLNKSGKRLPPYTGKAKAQVLPEKPELPCPAHQCTCSLGNSNDETENLPEWTTSPAVKSPNSLAPRGTLLRSVENTHNFFASCSTCSPSRYDPPTIVSPYQNTPPVTLQRYRLPSLNCVLTSPLEKLTGENTGGFVTQLSIISIRVNPNFKVDISINGAVRVVDFANGICMAMSASGKMFGMFHPIGSMMTREKSLDAVFFNETNNMYAKVYKKGIAFKSEKSAMSFMTDNSGTKTCNEKFDSDVILKDQTKCVFLQGIRYGPHYVRQASHILEKASFYKNSFGKMEWNVNRVKIVRRQDDVVNIFVNDAEMKMGHNRRATLSSPLIRCTASFGDAGKHMFIRAGENRIHYDGHRFVVRHYGQSAGLDEMGQINIY